jgi:hypothetical protein
MSTIPLVINKTMKYGEWIFDRDQEAADDAAAAAWDRRRSIERAVSFADVLEQMVDFSDVQQAEFMKALERGNSQDLHLIHCLIDQSREAIVKRRLAGGE